MIQVCACVRDFNPKHCLGKTYIYIYVLLDIGNNSAMSDEGSRYDDVFNIADDINNDDGDDEENDDEDKYSKNENLRASLRKWAMKYNTNHSAIKDLLTIINTRFGKKAFLPGDPRTLLKTPQTVTIAPLLDGEYWHHGLENCLKKAFAKLNKPISISLNTNIDGLPVFKSAKLELWPILFNIFEMPQVPAMVIGIFCGKAKSVDVNSFLTPFVGEMIEITANGVFVNSHKITVGIRCFVCDSPARAYVKGV